METVRGTGRKRVGRVEGPNVADSERAPLPGMTDQAQRAFAALGSRVRLRILEALAVRAMSLHELAKELGLNRTTLRYHLAVLQEQAWVRETAPAKAQGSGRPAVRYRASPHAWVGFPERHFELLGEIALHALVESTGPDHAASVLRAKGAGLGQSMVQGAAARADLQAWSPDAFERLVLHGLFREFGVVGAVVAKTPDDLTYRVYTCPFLELAEKMPGLVCDAMDAGFHDGIDRSMGHVATTKMACMGHGDAYCEYRLTWAEGRGEAAPEARLGGKEGRRRA